MATRERLVGALKELADELDTVPRTVEMARYGDYDPVIYHEEFGSWDDALEAAGMDPEEAAAPAVEETPVQPTSADDEVDDGYRHIAESRAEPTQAEEALLEDLRLFHETYSRTPTREDAADTVWIASPEEYDEAFGGVTEAAREAGIIDGSHHEANKSSEADRAELLDEVRKYHSLYGEVPSAEGIDGVFWTHGAAVYLDEFGDWETVLEEAGVGDDA